MAVAVLDKYGNPLMMTNCLGKVRHMLKDGRAKIYKHNPVFTIQLTYDVEYHTQKTETCTDLGYIHNGISVKSESHEYVARQSDMLTDEKDNYDSCRKYRRTRRNRKRYRAPRYNNRKNAKEPGRIPPSLKNKADRQVDLAVDFCKITNTTDLYVEVGQFDTQVLQAVEEGKPIPEGLDYQHGPTYGADTLRAAVFQRDEYKCVFCGRSAFEDGAILHEHHVYFWQGRHGNRLDELATCCEECHTPANHQTGGKLWGYDKGMANFSGAAFMNTVKWYVYNQLKERLPNVNVHITYGSITHRNRLNLGLEDTHINDAYSMGQFRPKSRAKPEYYKKRRRNNRVLEKFYDAQYIDIRDNEKRPGKELGCERTKRSEPRNGPKNLRIYHGKKVSKGRRSIRTKRYNIQPGTIFVCGNKKYVSGGVQHYGEYVTAKGLDKAVKTDKIKILKNPSGWVKTDPPKKKTSRPKSKTKAKSKITKRKKTSSAKKNKKK